MFCLNKVEEFFKIKVISFEEFSKNKTSCNWINVASQALVHKQRLYVSIRYTVGIDILES